MGYLSTTYVPPESSTAYPISIWYPATVTPNAALAHYSLAGNAQASISARAYSNVPVAPGTFPIILFSHGSPSTRIQSWFLLEALASHGYVVAAIEHTDNIVSSLCSSGAIPAITTSDRAGELVTLYAAILANADVKDHVLSDNVSLLGHSRGGATALTLAIQNTVLKQKLKSVAIMDGGDNGDDTPDYTSVKIPTLFLTASTTSFRQWVAEAGENINSGVCMQAVYPGADHQSFSNACGMLAGIPETGLTLDCNGTSTTIPKENIQYAYGAEITCSNPSQETVHRATAQLLTSFFSSYLMNDMVITLDTWKTASNTAKLPWQLFDCQHINGDQTALP